MAENAVLEAHAPLMAHAERLGFSVAEFGAILTQWGPKVAEDAAALVGGGLTIPTIINVVQDLGGLGVAVLRAVQGQAVLSAHCRAMAAQGPEAAQLALGGGLVQVLVTALLGQITGPAGQQLLQQLVPAILQGILQALTGQAGAAVNPTIPPIPAAGGR